MHLWGVRLIIAYIDESGDVGPLPATPRWNDQPTLTLAALLIDHTRLDSITSDFLTLKRVFFPGLAYPSSSFLDTVIPEVKGSDLRRSIALGNRNQRRHALRFFDKCLDLLEQNGVKLIARVWVKQPGSPFGGRSVYSASIQRLYEAFDHYLSTAQDYGFCIADSRTKELNAVVAHSIFTQKYSSVAPGFPRVLELPSFGHSDNHVGLQLCDLVASGLITPMACYEYCTGHIANVHVQPNYVRIKDRYSHRIMNLQYRYQDAMNKWRGGITVSDRIAKRSSAALFH